MWRHSVGVCIQSMGILIFPSVARIRFIQVDLTPNAAYLRCYSLLASYLPFDLAIQILQIGTQEPKSKLKRRKK